MAESLSDAEFEKRYGKVGGSSMSDDDFQKKYGMVPSLTPRPPGSEVSLPDPDWPRVGKFAVEALPAVGATVAPFLGPPGWAAGLGMAALGGAAGSLAKQGIKAAADTPDKPESVGGFAGEVAKDAAIGGASEVGGRLVSGLVRKMIPSGERLYQSALKPVFNKRQGGVARTKEMVRTGLSERIVPGEGGLEKSREIIDEINDQIMTGIKARSAMGKEVDLKSVVKRLDDLKKYYGETVKSKEHLAAIAQVEKNFIDQYSTKAPFTEIRRSTFDEAGETLPPSMQKFAPVAEREAVISTAVPLDKAQKIKMHEGTILRRSYGELSPAEAEARKQLVRGLKEEIESIFPEVKALNARESRLIHLEEALNRFVHREGNHQLAGIGTPLAGALGGHIAGPAGAVLTMATRAALDDPTIKTALAFALDRAGKSTAGKAVKAIAPHVPALTIRTGQALYETYGDPQMRRPALPPVQAFGSSPKPAPPPVAQAAQPPVVEPPPAFVPASPEVEAQAIGFLGKNPNGYGANTVSKQLKMPYEEAKAMLDNLVTRGEAVQGKFKGHTVYKKVSRNDPQNQPGLSSEVGVGQEPVQAEPVQSPSASPSGGSRVLQQAGQEEATVAPKRRRRKKEQPK